MYSVEFSFLWTSDGLPQMVRNFKALVQSPSSVILRWEAPSAESGDSVAFYKLFYSSPAKLGQSPANNGHHDYSNNNNQDSDEDEDYRETLDEGGETEIQVFGFFIDGFDTWKTILFLINFSFNLQVNGLSYVLHGLTADTQYDFRIEAVNGHGSGPPTAQVSVRTQSDVPSAPPRNVSVAALTVDVSGIL